MKAAEIGYPNLFVYAEGMPVWEERELPSVKGPNYLARVETEKIGPRELAALIASGKDDFMIVDVRDTSEYVDGHIPGAINIPLKNFALNSGQMDKDQQIIVYCNGGGRSNKAYGKLIKMGYKKNFQALFTDWKQAGQTVEK